METFVILAGGYFLFQKLKDRNKKVLGEKTKRQNAGNFNPAVWAAHEAIEEYERHDYDDQLSKLTGEIYTLEEAAKETPVYNGVKMLPAFGDYQDPPPPEDEEHTSELTPLPHDRMPFVSIVPAFDNI